MKQRIDKRQKKNTRLRRGTAVLVAVALCAAMVAGLVANGFAQQEEEPPAEPVAAQEPGEIPASEQTPGQTPEPEPEQASKPAEQQPAEQQPAEQQSVQPTDQTPEQAPGRQAEQGAAAGLGVAVARLGYADPQAGSFVTDAKENEPLRVAADFAATGGAPADGTSILVRLRNSGANYFTLPGFPADPAGIVESLPDGAQNLAVASAPAADAAGAPLLDAAGRQLYEINVTFTLSGGAAGGRLALAVPFDRRTGPEDGARLATVTALAERDGQQSAQTMDVWARRENPDPEQPVKQMSAEPVEITKLVSSNAAQYATNVGNTTPLVAEGTYFVNDPDGAAGTTVTVKLSNRDGKNYFTEPSAAGGQISLPAGASNLRVSTSGADILVMFDLTGDQYNSANFVVNFPFNHADWDGWIPKGTPLADIAVTADKAGAASTRTLAVTSDTSDTRWFAAFAKQPSGNVPEGRWTTVSLEFANRGYYEVPSNWRNEPGTDLRIVLEYPKGAVVENLTPQGNGVTGVDDPDAGTVTWTLGSADAQGNVTTGWSRTDAFQIERLKLSELTVTFPADKFPAGTDVELKACARYTLAGQAAETKKSAAPLVFQIEQNTDIRMKPNSVRLDGRQPLVSINTPAMISQADSVAGICNAGGAPIPETRLVWRNDPGENKAAPKDIMVTNIGAYFKSKFVFTVKNAGGQSREVTAYLDKAPSLGGSMSYHVSDLALTAGEYIDQFVWYALDNPNQTAAQLNSSNEVRALPFGAEAAVGVNFTSWGGKRFPGGRQIAHNDQSVTTMEVLWEKESRPQDHTAPAPSFDGQDTYSIAFSGDARQVVLYQADTPMPVAYYRLQANQNGVLKPGTDITLDLNFANYYGSSTDNWINPVLVVMPPDCMTLDTARAFPVYNSGGAKVADAAVSAGTLPDGRTIYRISAGAISLPRMYDSTAPYKVPVTFHIKEGTKPGTYYFCSTNGTGYPQTGGLLFGVSTAPYNLNYPAGYNTGSRYWADTPDIDANAATPYLRNAEQNVSIQVSSSMDVTAYATMFNNTADNGAGAWQNVAFPGAQATVPLNGTGQFRLEILNRGNTYAGGVQLTDSLPSVGDGRGSLWDAALSGLTVQVLDGVGNDVTAAEGYAYTLQYSTAQDPAPAAFSADAAMATARSFQFRLDASKRLPGGYRIVITGTVTAPATADISKIGQAAYNSFTVDADSYANAAGTAGQTAIPPIRPAKQKFVLVDIGTAKLAKSGFVFKDRNYNDRYDAEDQKYEGAVVELYVADMNGNPGADSYATTVTDAGGQYEFTQLPAADYIIRVLPAPDDGVYTYAAKGAAADNTASHVDAAGYSDKFTLSAGQQLSPNVNAGLRQAHTVTFLMNDGGGSVFATQAVAHGAAAAAPAPAPARAGYAFGGWFREAACTTAWDFASDRVNADTTLYAKWNAVRTVRFFTNNVGTELHATAKVTQPATRISPAEYPDDPAKTGLVFAGWYTLPGGGGTLFTQTSQVTADLDVYAKWERMALSGGYAFADLDDDGLFAGNDVKFGLDGLEIGLYRVNGASVEQAPTATTRTAADGSYAFGAVDAGTYRVKPLVAAPYASARQNMAANGSHPDQATGYSADIVVAEGRHTAAPVNIGIVATATLRVKFMAGGTQVGNTATLFDDKHDISRPYSVTAGTDVPVPDARHYTLPGGATQTVTFAWDDLDKTAVFQLKGNTYTVTFDKNGGDTEASPRAASVTWPQNNLSAMPAPPTRQGHTFDGWLMPGGQARFSLGTPVESDMTVRADWTPVQYQLRFDANGAPGGAIPAQNLRMGDRAAEPAAPAWPGHSFLGWNTAQNGGGANWNFGTDVMPARDVTLYAQWRAEETPVPSGTPAPTAPAPTPVPGAGAGSAPPADNGETAAPRPTVSPSATAAAPSGGVAVSVPTAIGGGEVPLVNEAGTAAWALLNLILALAAIGFALVALAVGIVRARNEEDSEEFPGTDEQRGGKPRPAWLAAGVLLGIASVVVFLLTENMDNAMVWMDKWTLLMAGLAAGTVAASLIALAGKRAKGQTDDAAGRRLGRRQ